MDNIQTKPSIRWSDIITKVVLIVLGLFLILSAIMTVFPFLWSAILATRDRTEIFGVDLSFALGDSLAYNYEQLLKSCRFGSRCLTALRWRF